MYLGAREPITRCSPVPGSGNRSRGFAPTRRPGWWSRARSRRRRGCRQGRSKNVVALPAEIGRCKRPGTRRPTPDPGLPCMPRLQLLSVNPSQSTRLRRGGISTTPPPGESRIQSHPEAWARRSLADTCNPLVFPASATQSPTLQPASLAPGSRGGYRLEALERVPSLVLSFPSVNTGCHVFGNLGEGCFPSCYTQVLLPRLTHTTAAQLSRRIANALVQQTRRERKKIT